MRRIKFDGVPSCSSLFDWMMWKEAARRCLPGPAGFCEDCTPDYAASMRACGRCEHPEIVFTEEGQGQSPCLIR